MELTGDSGAGGAHPQCIDRAPGFFQHSRTRRHSRCMSAADLHPGDLSALRPLARRLVSSDADADDLLQDTAVGVLRSPPPPDRPLRAWLSVVVLNRFRMNARAAARRAQREETAALREPAPSAEMLLERAESLAALGRALLTLKEPVRTAVMRRYIDGVSAAQIARESNVSAGTVRWRIHEGLRQLREALDADRPRATWVAALTPWSLAEWSTGAGESGGAAVGKFAVGAILMKSKSTVLAIALLVCLLLGGGAIYLGTRKPQSSATTNANAPSELAAAGRRVGDIPSISAGEAGIELAPILASEGAEPGKQPGVEKVDARGGIVSGRVINWSTGEPVADAEVAFASAHGAVTARTDERGAFALAPTTAGRFRLATLAKAGFLPYAPEWSHSPIVIETRPGLRTTGLVVYLFPAVQYTGTVVDEKKVPIANANVKMVGTPMGEQALDRLPTTFVTDAKGTFTFHAPDHTIFEA